MQLKKTSLHAEHLKAKARMVDFTGWEMPVQYEGLKQEHLHVRSACGIFDVSHMGEIFFSGPKALESLQFMTTNDVSKLEAGKAHYSLIVNADGGIVDDIIVYCMQENQEYLVCVNAANIEKDYQHFLKYNQGAEITNASNDWSQIAIQGPKSPQVLEKIFSFDINKINAFEFVKHSYKGEELIIAKTGYTGEVGVEVFLPHVLAPILWQELMAFTEVRPIGLGARDTLRLEKKFPLYGHELSDTTNPTEARLNWVVRLDKGDFMARDKLAQFKELGTPRYLICLKMQDKGIPRENYKVFSADEEEVGIVTSGTLSPSLGEGIAIAYVDSKCAKNGTELKIDIRGRKAKAIVVKAPFV